MLSDSSLNLQMFTSIHARRMAMVFGFSHNSPNHRQTFSPTMASHLEQDVTVQTDVNMFC